MSPVFIALSLCSMGLISLVLNFLLLKWTRTLGAKNEAGSDELRWSKSYKPAIGGVSFYIIFLISYLSYLFITSPSLSNSQELVHFGILLVVTFGFFTGLADDAFNTVPWLKFTAQLICGGLLILFDIRIDFFGFYWADVLLTVFWTVSVMNSINMLDNMDGVTTVVSMAILASAGACALPLSDANLFYTFACGGTIAALFGFLVFNWHPSKIFMGDTGSQMLGALLAAVGVLFFWNNEAIIETHSWVSKLIIVLTAFVVPIADSLTVTINRLLRGQSPFVGGRDHTTHHLSYAGLSDSQVALVMSLLSVSSVTLMVVLRHIKPSNLHFYLMAMAAFSLLVISFLYGTTLWKKSRSVYRTKNLD